MTWNVIVSVVSRSRAVEFFTLTVPSELIEKGADSGMILIVPTNPPYGWIWKWREWMKIYMQFLYIINSINWQNISRNHMCIVTVDYLVEISDRSFEQNSINRRVFHQCHRVAGFIKLWSIIINILYSDRHYCLSCLHTVVCLGCLKSIKAERYLDLDNE